MVLRALVGPVLFSSLVAVSVHAVPGPAESARPGQFAAVARGTTLKALARRHRLSIGAAVNAHSLTSGDARYRATAAKTFNVATTEGEMRWAYTEPERGHYDFSAANAVVSFARQHGMAVRGHNLVWFDENPAWLENGTFSRAQLVKILRRHITTVVSHFRGRVAQWDVVNEPLDGNGHLRDSVWLRGIGPSYIAKSFRWAHHADPHARLFVNEFGIEVPGRKLNGMVSLVSSLRRRRVPISGVGFESHFGLTGTLSRKTGRALGPSMRRFDKLGVATAVTELDVALPAHPSAHDLALQARVYTNALRGCLTTSTCRTVVVWGVDDGHSWVPQYSRGRGAATLFTSSYRPKPAYIAWRRLLGRASRSPRGRGSVGFR
jgi:endo-1,4-beta-xylanase